MTTIRSATTALFAAALLLAVSVGTALAAFQTVTLSAPAAPVGASVTVNVEISVRTGGYPTSELYLVAQDAFEQSPSDAFCGQIAGAIMVGDLSWQEATIEFQGQQYAGFVGEGGFTVPNTALGAYYLTESFDSEHAGPGCHRFTGFAVTSTSVPDTRTIPGSIGRESGRLALGAIGASVLLVFLALGAVRAGRRMAQ